MMNTILNPIGYSKKSIVCFVVTIAKHFESKGKKRLHTVGIIHEKSQTKWEQQKGGWIGAFIGQWQCEFVTKQIRRTKEK